MRKHTVHVWKLYRPKEVLCIVCGICRRVPWVFDPAELADQGRWNT